MYVFPMECYPDPDADPSVVMIVVAASETDAVELAFEHPNASQYAAVKVSEKGYRKKKAKGLERGIHGFVNWKAFEVM